MSGAYSETPSHTSPLPNKSGFVGLYTVPFSVILTSHVIDGTKFSPLRLLAL